MRQISVMGVCLVLFLSVASSPTHRTIPKNDYDISSWASWRDSSSFWKPIRNSLSAWNNVKNPLNLSQGWNSLRLLFTRGQEDEDVEDDAEDVNYEDFLKRDTYNCTDLSAAFDSRCWDELDINDYLLNPTTGWNHTARICSEVESAEDNDGSDCCKPEEPWTTCYLRLAHGTPGQDCSEINSQFCSYQSTLAPGMDPSIKPEVQYVMKNIYAVNDFFTTYYTALGQAESDAQTIVQALINELDPVKKTTFGILAFFTALSVGLAFLGAPSVAVAVLGLSVLTKVVAQVLTISLQQAPSTAKALWPSGTQSSQSIQIGNVETELGSSANQLASMINNAVELLMSDMPTFAKFCEHGQWSGSESLSLPSKVGGLDYALRTYMTSEVMAQNGWTSTAHLGPYESVAELESSTTGGDGFSCQMGNNSVCNGYDSSAAYYWSQRTGMAYTFVNKNPAKAQVSPYQLLQDVVDNNWAILEVLFDGAYNCTLAGQFGNSVVNFNWDGTLDIACISQLPTTMPCGTPSTPCTASS